MSDRPPHPDTLSFGASAVPDELTERDQWVSWRYQWTPDRDEWSKVPRDVSGGYASSTDADTWTDFDSAVEHYNDHDSDGVGFVVHEDGIVAGVDLDGCRDPQTGDVDDWATDIIGKLDSYTEVSPSGTGFRVFVLGFKPGDSCKQVMESQFDLEKTSEIEIYDSGRYLTVTGHHVDGTPTSVEQRNSALSDVYEEYMVEDEDEDEESGYGAEPVDVDLEDEEIIQKARNAGNGDDFARLFDCGDTSAHGGDHSRADLALCGHLAFWTGGDRNRIDRLFRQSALMRDKWDEDRGSKTYGELTIDEALKGRTDFYDPSQVATTDGGTAAVSASESFTVGAGDGVRFKDAPAEPVVDDEDRVSIVKPEPGTTDVTVKPIGKWVCQQCGTVSGEHATVGDSVKDPGNCPSCGKSGPWEPVVDDDVPAQFYLQEAWDYPKAVDESDFEELWDDVRQYIYDHWDAGANNGHIYDGLTAYALSTWLRPDLDFVPHIMLMGRYTGGKTRLLNTLSRLSYRCIVSASASPSSMFRLIDAYDTTFFVSEYHGLDPDTRRELDAVVRAAQKRGETVTRSVQMDGGGFEPEVLDPFTHVAVATQYEPADDIVSRCIEVKTSPATREMPPTLDDERATSIRNRLLYARFRLLGSNRIKIAKTNAYEYLAEHEIDGRLREKLLSALMIADIWGDVGMMDDFVDYLVSATKQAEAKSEDAIFTEAVRDLAFESVGRSSFDDPDTNPFGDVEIPYSDIADRFNDISGQDRSNSWIGHVVSRHNFETQRKRDGTVIADPELGEKLQDLCSDYSLGWEPLDSINAVAELDKPYNGQCSACGDTDWIAYEDVEYGDRLCGQCADELRD
ncbi:phage NrS-1 polymerase family protein [Haladaptatus salinisoli]|uniref:phage NrS-1 polymerase family protein n=1 Tax=Haladaptatus salinisoli TaxID=2884876 RepID=UPI001D0AECBC|nr:hypothetical protein [Haladaptatus salinisoli]